MTVSNEHLKFLMEEMDKGENLQEEILKEIQKGEFLVPVILPEELKNQTIMKGEFTIDEETPAAVKPLQDEEGKLFLPLFTDTSELRKSGENITALVFDLHTIKEVVLEVNDGLEAVVINPFSEFILTLSREDFMKLE